MKKLLLVGNAYWVEMNRQKVLELGRWFDVSCVTHSSEGHELMGREQGQKEVGRIDREKGLYILKAKGSTQGGTKFTLDGLGPIIRDVQPDIILVETEPWARIFWQVIWAYKRFCPHAMMGLFSWENIRRPGLKGLVLDQVYRAAVCMLDFVIAGNREAKELFEQAGMASERIHVDAQLGFIEKHLPENKEQHRREMRERWGVEQEAVIVGFCGRFVKEKGIWELIEAMECLVEREERSLELHFLGGGPLESELQEYTKKYDWLRLHEPVPHDQVVGVMNAWDVFVLPSKRLEENGQLWEEQFGHVLLNAMGAGCVTLGSRSGAIPEVLGDEETVIFEPGNAESLTKRIQEYLDHPEQGQMVIESQTLRAREHYSFARIAERYYKHIQMCAIL